MARYEVAVWLSRRDDSPDVQTAVLTSSPERAVKIVLLRLHVAFAVKVEARTADGLLLWRWSPVMLFSDGGLYAWSHGAARVL
jgi:hypothetical protein